MNRIGWRSSYLLVGLLIMSTINMGCCACKKKLDPSNEAEFEKARAAAERVGTDLMDCITVFDKKSPTLTLFEWDLKALKRRGYRLSYQDGILTLKKFRKRWDVYFCSLGKSFKPELTQRPYSLRIKVHPFPPEPDPTVIIDHGDYLMSLIEDQENTWRWYLDPRPPAGYFPTLAGWPGEYELRGLTRRGIAEYRE